jgi:hypothetical protein
MLHNALLAVATAFSDDPVIKDPTTRQRYADKAKSFLENECELPKLSAMTALSVLANYYSSTNHPTLGYIYFGILGSARSDCLISDSSILLGISARMSQARKVPCTSSFVFGINACLSPDSWIRH